MTYVEQIDGILERFEFAPVSRKDLRRRANILKWVEAMDGEGLPIDLPEILLEEAFRTHYSELTVGQFVDVTNGIDQNRAPGAVEEPAAEEQAAARPGRAHDHPGRVGRGQRQAQGRGAARRPAAEGSAPPAVGGVLRLAAEARVAAPRARWLDRRRADVGGDHAPLNEAGARETEMQAAAAQPMHAWSSARSPAARRPGSTRKLVPEIGREPLADGADHGRLELGQRGQPRPSAPRQQVDRCPGAGHPRHALEPASCEFVQGVIDFINTYWPEIAAKAQRVNGMPPVEGRGGPDRREATARSPAATSR